MEYYVPKSSILLAGTGVWKISSVTCGFSSIKIDYSDYPKRLISRINEVYVFFFNKIPLYCKKHKLHLSRLFCCTTNIIAPANAVCFSRLLHIFDNIIQLMYSFEINIRICQPEKSDGHRGKAEVNITFEG